ncbi:MAG: hypothetical protein OQK98_15845 [Gammaproteobacteria bacterium]|nr:hypothetical protein [Gammaproteobacteria bacterium]
MNQKRVIQAIENICSMGCTTVKAIIITLEMGNKVEGTEDFSEDEIKELEKELKSIMAVYEDKA